MDYKIKTYNSDPNIDFNRIQANIYNSVSEPYTGYKVTAEQIKRRIEEEKFDINGMIYAFSIDNKPLAYIRYYVYPSGSLYIGYPWCTPDCPKEIQEDLFNQLKRYVKQKYPTYTKAVMGMADNSIKPFHDFAKEHGFVRNYWENIYHIDVSIFSRFDLGEFSYREATIQDLEGVTRIATEDLDFIGQETVLSEEEIKFYLREEILPFENCVVLLMDDTIIGATSVLRNQIRNLEKVTVIKFESISKNYESIRINLYIALAKLLVDKGLTNEKIFLSKDYRNKHLLESFEKHGLKIMGGETQYSVEL